ncbi:MAG TPA: putative motility protein [Clostridia bacterium]|nr:putative motility protein [Clostridia bacterium]
MNVSMDMSGLQSVRQALGIANMRTALKQDAESVAYIMKSLQETSAKTLEMSVTPHIGGNIDLKG